MKFANISSVEEISKKHAQIKNANTVHKGKLTALDKAAIWITDHVGSMGFFMIIFCWTAVWLSWNTLAPAIWRFDPYPAFVLWLFISNMIQIFLMPLIMIGQNLQSRHAEIRSEQDFAVNKKAEAEAEAILKHLENQNDLIIQILTKLEQMQGK
ncbi:MAG: DUF1003 domain-containing protein [Bacteroidetes bacterium]|nr:DUF1003 domain-containing protein [Bacteroidota bacterium]